jgi:hypothetical protein
METEMDQVMQAQAEFDAKFAAFQIDPSFDNHRDAEIARKALSAARDDHERATRTGHYAPVDCVDMTSADFY